MQDGLVHLPTGTILHTTSTWIHYALPARMREAVSRLASLNAQEQPRLW